MTEHNPEYQAEYERLNPGPECLNPSPEWVDRIVLALLELDRQERERGDEAKQDLSAQASPDELDGWDF